MIWTASGEKSIDMILQREILLMAEKAGVPTYTIDKDWVLGHVLNGLFRKGWAQKELVFKGGTCLRKCHIDGYRFSEDLDFTIRDSDFIITSEMMGEVFRDVTQNVGILFGEADVLPILWEDREVGYKLHVPFWGADHRRNQIPPTPSRWLTGIKMEFIKYERLVNEVCTLPLMSHYSDANAFDGLYVPCYAMEEVLAEKFRALLQRSYPAPRDYYDLWYILSHKANVDWECVRRTFGAKCEYKGIDSHSYLDFFNESELEKVSKAWKNSIGGHLPAEQLPQFDDVIRDLKQFCADREW